MLLKMFCDGQQVGELPIANYKSACYYVLEQIVEHRIDQWDFNDIEHPTDVPLCLTGYSLKDREQVESILASGAEAVVFRDGDVVHLFTVNGPESLEWRDIFDLFKKMYDNDQRQIFLTT